MFYDLLPGEMQLKRERVIPYGDVDDFWSTVILLSWYSAQWFLLLYWQELRSMRFISPCDALS